MIATDFGFPTVNRVAESLHDDRNGRIAHDELNKHVETMVNRAGTDGDGGESFDELRNLRIAKMA